MDYTDALPDIPVRDIPALSECSLGETGDTSLPDLADDFFAEYSYLGADRFTSQSEARTELVYESTVLSNPTDIELAATALRRVKALHDMSPGYVFRSSGRDDWDDDPDEDEIIEALRRGDPDDPESRPVYNGDGDIYASEHILKAFLKMLRGMDPEKYATLTAEDLVADPERYIAETQTRIDIANGVYGGWVPSVLPRSTLLAEMDVIQRGLMGVRIGDRRYHAGQVSINEGGAPASLEEMLADADGSLRANFSGWVSARFPDLDLSDRMAMADAISPQLIAALGVERAAELERTLYARRQEVEELRGGADGLAEVFACAASAGGNVPRAGRRRSPWHKDVSEAMAVGLNGAAQAIESIAKHRKMSGPGHGF